MFFDSEKKTKNKKNLKKGNGFQKWAALGCFLKNQRALKGYMTCYNLNLNSFFTHVKSQDLVSKLFERFLILLGTVK